LGRKKIIAPRKTIKCLEEKTWTAKCYGGDHHAASASFSTKQKEGKEEDAPSSARVDIPQEAFIAALKNGTRIEIRVSSSEKPPPGGETQWGPLPLARQKSRRTRQGGPANSGKSVGGPWPKSRF